MDDMENVVEEQPTVEALETVCTAALPPDAAENGTILITAKKNGKQATVSYTFGKDLKGMAELFGKDVTFSQALAQMKIKAQAIMRAALVAGKDPSEIIKSWKPGIAMPKMEKDPTVATLSYFDKLSEEEQAAMLAKLQERVAG